jgi:ketosteroid isomerase-like protein
MTTRDEHSSLEANKQLVRRFVEHGFLAAMAGDPNAIHEFLADEYVNHTSLSAHAGAHDRAGMKDTTQNISAAMPDMQIHVRHILAEGDLVAVHYTAEARHTGQARHRHGRDQQLAPTGQDFRSSGIGIHRVRDGKIVESWVYNDEVEALARVGALSITPATAQT